MMEGPGRRRGWQNCPSSVGLSALTWKTSHPVTHHKPKQVTCQSQSRQGWAPISCRQGLAGWFQSQRLPFAFPLRCLPLPPANTVLPPSDYTAPCFHHPLHWDTSPGCCEATLFGAWVAFLSDSLMQGFVFEGSANCTGVLGSKGCGGQAVPSHASSLGTPGTKLSCLIPCAGPWDLPTDTALDA